MDSGGYVVAYNSPPYIIFDEKEYFAVNLDYKQIAAFKTKDAAVEYVLWKNKILRDIF